MSYKTKWKRLTIKSRSLSNVSNVIILNKSAEKQNPENMLDYLSFKQMATLNGRLTLSNEEAEQDL